MTPIALTGRVRTAVRGWLQTRSAAPGGARRGTAPHGTMLFHPPGAIRIVTPAELAATSSTPEDAAQHAPPTDEGGTAP